MRSLKIFVMVVFIAVASFTYAQSTDSLIEKSQSDSLIIPEGMTGEKVIANYVEAIGGAENLTKIVDRTTVMRGVVQGVNIIIVSYQKVPNKLKQEIRAGEVDQKVYFDGEHGVQMIGGSKTEIDSAELEKLKIESTIILLLELDHYGVKTNIVGVELVNKKPAYKIEMTLPSGTKWTQFYDKDTFLKVKEIKAINTPQGSFTHEILYSDYKVIEGLKYAFKITQKIGGQSMDFNVSSIKINSGLSDREFEIE
jgi:phosphotransferase system IIB component